MSRSQNLSAATRPPVLIGAVGGSGTRVVTRILAQAGFFIGAHRNHAEDSEPIMDFFNTWLRPYIMSGGSLPDSVARSAAEDFWEAIANHRHGIEHADCLWAVKVPRSLLMLTYWCQAFPTLQFIHVIRNGLDMAYSADNNQLQMFQDLVLPATDQPLPQPLRAMAYWRTVNLQAAAIGESSLGTRYHTLRFEDLCSKPQTVIERLAAFVGIRIDVAAALGLIVPPRTIDRWRAHPHAQIRSLVALGRPALERFGYWNPELSDALARQ